MRRDAWSDAAVAAIEPLGLRMPAVVAAWKDVRRTTAVVHFEPTEGSNRATSAESVTC